MRLSPLTTSRRGFSILVALGTIGILLIIVTGLATVYSNEMKLSRMQYDNILAYAGSEGAFEYAMLKARNHREGFADEMTSTDIEASLLRGSTDRTKSIDLHYTIHADSMHETFPVGANGHLIIPLFTAQSSPINSSPTSKNPIYSANINPVASLKKLETSASENDISWSIIGMKNGVSFGLAGTGNITPTKTGILRKNGTDCYDSTGIATTCNGGEKEAIDYFYDETMGVDTFLASGISDPYLLVYNK